MPALVVLVRGSWALLKVGYKAARFVWAHRKAIGDAFYNLRKREFYYGHLKWNSFLAFEVPRHILAGANEHDANYLARAERFLAHELSQRSMSVTPRQKRQGTFPRGYIDARKKARLDSDDAEGVARDLAPEFEMAQAAAGGGALGQRKQYRKKLGRKKNVKALSNGLARTAVQSAVVRYQELHSYENPGMNHGTAGGVGSYYNLAHRQHTPNPAASSTTSMAVYPVHLFDLTSCPKPAKAMDAATKTIDTWRIGPMWHLGSDATGKFEWNQTGIFAQGPTGSFSVNDSRWWIEQITRGNNSAKVNQAQQEDSAVPIRTRAYLRWSDIRLQFLGARAMPTNVHVYIVKFKDPDFDPYTNGRTYAGTPTDLAGTNFAYTGTLDADKQQEWNSYCKAWLKPKIFNPLDVQYTQASDKFKILYHKKISFKPDTNVNLDTNRPTVDCKVFHQFDRMINFNWDDAANAVVTQPQADAPGANNINPNVTTTIQAEYGGEMDQPVNQQYIGVVENEKPYAAPRSRVFLMIVGEDYIDKQLPVTGYGRAGTEAVPVWNDPVGSAKTPVAAQTATEWDGTTSNTTSYNIVLRNKWMYAA